MLLNLFYISSIIFAFGGYLLACLDEYELKK